VLTSPAGNPYIVGAQEAQAGEAYTLHLFTAGAAFDTWTIDWGDGTANTTGPRIFEHNF